MKLIDLRSDTVTKPDKNIIEEALHAELGDDEYGEDPTVNNLQEKCAELLGFESGLFVSSGLMGNQISLLIHNSPGTEVITTSDSHIKNYEHGAASFLSKNIQASVINAGDGSHEHPTQALLDSFSILEKMNDIKGKNILLLGDIKHSRVALSNIFCLQKLGANVRVCGPPTLIPKNIHDLNVEVSFNLKESLNWCDAVNVLRIQLERQNLKLFPSLREYTMMYGVNKELLQTINKEILILHPGPINRGVEITSEVADSHQSIILNQVENGVAIRMAVLYLLASKIKIS